MHRRCPLCTNSPWPKGRTLLLGSAGGSKVPGHDLYDVSLQDSVKARNQVDDTCDLREMIHHRPVLMALRIHSAPVYSSRTRSESRLVRRNEQRPSARPRFSTRLLSSRVYSMVTENGHQPSTCWLVTGANRGIGLEYVQQLLSQKTNRVAAGFRSDSRELEALQQEAQDRLLLVKIDVKDESTSKASKDSSPSNRRAATPLLRYAEYRLLLRKSREPSESWTVLSTTREL